MLKLLKYEIRKGLMLKLVLFGIFALLEGGFLYGCLGGRSDTTVLCATLLFIEGLFGVMALGVQSMMTLHRDMNTKQAYMLFMTPRNSYAILGAKLLESVFSILVASALCVGTAFLDAQLITQHFTHLDDLMEMIRQMT